MTKDQIYEEIKNGRKWRVASFKQWLDFDELKRHPCHWFYENEIELEPIPERTFLESQILEAVDYAYHPAYSGISSIRLLERLGITKKPEFMKP